MATEISSPDGCEFAITRIIAAPRELVFKRWTDPRLMALWWGPHGFTNPACEMGSSIRRRGARILGEVFLAPLLPDGRILGIVPL
jgi:uncharacterized protein YndB with AHSA1/START domain